MAPVNRPLDRAGMVSELKAIRIAYNVPEGEQPVRVVNSFKVASASDPKRVKKFPFAKEQRAWKCPECNRFLSSKRSFNEHMNIHSQKRPFACEFCEYSAASQMTLRRHVLRNHTPAQDWGYRCPYCPQVYMEPASYQQHVSSKHPGRSCTYGCPYKLCPFSSKCFRHFREHIRKHDASERFNGPTDRQPCTRSDQELIMYLVDDDIGTGYKGLSTSTTVIRRRVMTKPVKTVIYTNSLVHRGPPRLEEEEYYPEMEIDDFMKQPLSLLPRTSAPRTVEMEETGELIVDGEIMPADNDWIEQEIEIQDTQTAESRRIASISSKGRKTMMTLSGETVPDIILHSLPKSSLETNMNVDVGFGDSLLDAAPSSHTLSVEGRSPDEGESSTSNILKLSVGCEDSEDDLDYGDNGNLNAQLRSWRMQTGPSSSQFENDFDMELPSEQIKAMITGEEYMFPQTGQRDFAEEVFMVKEPKIVHGYLFGELIGEGSYSKVKEVIEEDSLVRRAIKIIKHNRVRKIPNGVENVQREIKILRKLKHKHVINLIETFRNEEKGKLYIVLEFCLGSLQRHIDSAPGGRLHEYEAHMYFVQLTEGLEYIHSKGIVHKDIKPGNLLLGPDLTLKISDFGVAEELPMFQPDDTCIIVQGTPKFQAPELVSGNTRTFKGFKSDIWSCGVTLFNMISGLYPFEGDAIMKLFENIAHEPLLMPSNVSVTDDLKVFLHGILDKNPLLRWNNDQIKHSTWFNRLFDQKEIDEFLSFKRTIHRPLTVSQGLEALFSDNASLKRGLSIPEVIMEEEIQVHIIPIHKDDPNIIHREIPIHIEPPPPPSRSSRRVFGCFAPSRSP